MSTLHQGQVIAEKYPAIFRNEILFKLAVALLVDGTVEMTTSIVDGTSSDITRIVASLAAIAAYNRQITGRQR